ncbi:MAG TPA: hypothetical protein VKP69_22765, partial [Isosphaeraceae bacterium]|nr:hypothetical protein [Isosphaeraceae bacterium]
MRAPQELQAMVTAEPVTIQDQRLILQAQIGLELPRPDQDADRPRRLEAGIERGGQVLKRGRFQHAVAQADAELVLAQRQGKEGQGIIGRGTTPLTFQTVFGTVPVPRRRIEPHADGTTEVPSAHAGPTPRQVALTPGLRDAACDDRLRDSAPQTVARIDTRAGESGVLAKTTVLEVVPAEGQQLQAAAHARVELAHGIPSPGRRPRTPAPRGALPGRPRRSSPAAPQVSLTLNPGAAQPRDAFGGSPSA